MFSAFNWVNSKRRRVVYISFLKEVFENMWVGLYIDYIARLTSFKLPLSFLLGRFKKGG